MTLESRNIYILFIAVWTNVPSVASNSWLKPIWKLIWCIIAGTKVSSVRNAAPDSLSEAIFASTWCSHTWAINVLIALSPSGQSKTCLSTFQACIQTWSMPLMLQPNPQILSRSLKATRLTCWMRNQCWNWMMMKRISKSMFDQCSFQRLSIIWE